MIQNRRVVDRIVEVGDNVDDDFVPFPNRIGSHVLQEVRLGCFLGAARLGLDPKRTKFSK